MQSSANGTGTRTGNAVADRVGALRRHDTARAPRERHAGCALRHDGDDFRVWRVGLEPAADAGRQRTVAERHKERVDVGERIGHLGGNGAGALGNGGVRSVFDEDVPETLGMGLRERLGFVEVGAVDDDLGAEPAHGVDFRGVRAACGEHGHRVAAPSGVVGEALAEIAR